MHVSDFMRRISLANHPVTRVKHLHIYFIWFPGAWDQFVGRIFDLCPRLVTLWLDHDVRYGIVPPLRRLDRLQNLRDLTIPMVYATGGEFPEMRLPSVTHLHFVPVYTRDKLHVPWLRSFPKLTHLGFMEETKHECVVRAANSKPALIVLVRGPRLSPIHDQVVYLLYSSLTPCSDWLKRASPAWNPDHASGPVWDPWMFADHVMAQRKRGM